MYIYIYIYSQRERENKEREREGERGREREIVRSLGGDSWHGASQLLPKLRQVLGKSAHLAVEWNLSWLMDVFRNGCRFVTGGLHGSPTKGVRVVSFLWPSPP